MQTLPDSSRQPLRAGPQERMLARFHQKGVLVSGSKLVQHVRRIDRLREGVTDLAGQNNLLQVSRSNGFGCSAHQITEIRIFFLPVHAGGHRRTAWHEQRGSSRLDGFRTLPGQQVSHQPVAPCVRFQLQSREDPTSSSKRHPSGTAFHRRVEPAPRQHRGVGHQTP